MSKNFEALITLMNESNALYETLKEQKTLEEIYAVAKRAVSDLTEDELVQGLVGQRVTAGGAPDDELTTEEAEALFAFLAPLREGLLSEDDVLTDAMMAQLSGGPQPTMTKTSTMKGNLV